jgi:hypothetical protein
MKKLFLWAALTFLCASFGWAQQSDKSTGSSDPSGTIKGCLSGSDGNYMLTQDETGAKFRLVGNEDKLKSHIGHELLVTGQLGNAASAADPGENNPSASASGGSSARSSVVQVSDIKMVSKHCSSGTDASQSRY